MDENKNNKKKHELHDTSEILDVFGKYQVTQYSFVFALLVFVTMIDANYVFVAGDLNFRCRVPECEDPNWTVESPFWWPNTTHDRCLKPVLRQDFSNGTCSPSSFSNTVEVCGDWIYESNNTVVAELNLACQPWKVNLIGTIHSIGMLVSMLISGWATDRFGRKFTMIICGTGSCIGLLKTYATSWNVYVGIEFLEACMSGGTYTGAMIIMLEIVGKSKRILSGVLFSYFIYIGESIFACIAMFVPNWKNIIRIINSPCILFISYVFLMHESPRWAIVNGKVAKAKETLLLIAKVNKININREELNDLDTVRLKEKFNIEEHEITEKLTVVLTSKTILLRLFVSSVCRFTSSFIYYGLMMNSVWLPGDKYVNFLLATVMSFPGELISLLLMNRIGRKLPLMVGYVISGILCVASAYIPDTYNWAKILLFLVSKMVISACFTGAITYTMELFPTSARGSLLGIGCFASRLGGMLAPLTPILNTVSNTLPSILFGFSAVLSGVLLSLTPETKDLPLMDTVQQVEESVRRASDLKKSRKNVNAHENFGYCKDSTDI